MPRRKVAKAPAHPHVLAATEPFRVPDTDCLCAGCRGIQGYIQTLVMRYNCYAMPQVKEAVFWYLKNAVRRLKDGRFAVLTMSDATDAPGEGSSQFGGAILRIAPYGEDAPDLYVRSVSPFVDQFWREHFMTLYDPEPVGRVAVPAVTYLLVAMLMRDYVNSTGPDAMVSITDAALRSLARFYSASKAGRNGTEKNLRDSLRYYGLSEVANENPCLSQRSRIKGVVTIHGSRRGPTVGVLPQKSLAETVPPNQAMATPPQFISCDGTNICGGDSRCVYHSRAASSAQTTWVDYYRTIPASMRPRIAARYVTNEWPAGALTDAQVHETMRAPPANVDVPPITYPALRADTMVRMVGVEVEFNGDPPAETSAWARKWGGQIHSDGSCSGHEACTPPAAGVSFSKCVRELCDTLRAVTADKRCGLHVHVDARDLGWADIIRLCKVWTRVESAMYVLGGQLRDTSTYAKPMAPSLSLALASTDVKGSIIGVILGKGAVPRTFSRSGRTYTARSDAEAVRLGMRFEPPTKKHGGRYRSMNLIPWLAGRKDAAQDLTVEFRLHCNTKQRNRIVQWASLLSHMVQWVATHTDAEADALPKSGMRALCVMVPEHTEWVIGRIKEWRRATQVSGERNEESGEPMVRRRFAPVKGVWACVA